MKATDRTIIFGVALVVLAAAFYLMILSPKRDKAAELGEKIDSLEASISEQEQVAAFAEQARQQFPRYYGRLVVLGKAVPQDADTSSMLVQLNSIARNSGVDFRGVALSQGASGAGTSSAPATAAPATPPPSGGESQPAASGDSAPAASTESTSGSAPASSPSSGGGAPAGSATAPAPATEASAATLPIGAVVGPAGLPTLPYELTFKGGFFNIADYIGGLDKMVTIREANGQVAANGRLLTVDGFGITGGAPGANPELDATFLVTSYVTPEDQGLTAGATPSGPAPANPAQPQTTPASSGTVTP